MMQTGEKFSAPPPLSCLGCGKCEKECVANIPIHLYFELFNDALKAGGVSSEIRRRFDETVSSGVNMPPSECVGCRKCEAVCPEHIQISEMNGILAMLFEK
ncbi:MAG: 4Fe-4S dicluster domain-containing protein [Eubacteriales bacterium]|nr:4Fe-4S dicluster domain-containing protein [Eubacteriales bacterium]